MNNKTQAEIAAYAQTLWASFTANEQHGVRFGMFPAGPMLKAEKDGFSGRELSVALMNMAAWNGRRV